MAAVPVLLAFLVSFKIMLFDERYLMASAPFLYVAVSAAVMEVAGGPLRGSLSPWKRGFGWAASGILACLILLSLHNYYFNPRFGRESWREAVSYVESSTAGGGELIVFDPNYVEAGYRYYGRRDLQRWRSSPPNAGLADSIRKYRTIWLVRSHYDNDDVLNILRKSATERGRRDFPNGKGIEVFRFEVQPGGSE